MLERAKAHSDAPIALSNAYHLLKIAAIEEETGDARSIVFETPAASDKFTYRPGQFLTLRIPSGKPDRPFIARCYSLASTPGRDELMKVTVKRVDGGLGSNWLCDNLAVGDDLEVLPPAGHFTPKSQDHDFLLIAGGSGITPIMSILKSALAAGTGRLVMIYANRDERSVIFAAELAELARRHADRLTVHHWLETVQGLPGVDQLAALIRDYALSEAFICGPQKFMNCAEAALERIGMDRHNIHSERFVSLSEDPGAAILAAVNPADDVAGDITEASVQFDGERHSLAWSASRSLLDTLLAAGISAPFSCREGKCSACVCFLREGTVAMDFNGVLDRSDLEEGWILACQAKPTSQHVDVSFDE